MGIKKKTLQYGPVAYIVCCQGASQLGGSLLGIPPVYNANKLKESLSYPPDLYQE